MRKHFQFVFLVVQVAILLLLFVSVLYAEGQRRTLYETQHDELLAGQREQDLEIRTNTDSIQTLKEQVAELKALDLSQRLTRVETTTSTSFHLLIAILCSVSLLVIGSITQGVLKYVEHKNPLKNRRRSND